MAPVTPTELSDALRAALAAAVADGTLALPADALPDTVHVERPRQREHGDWATNVALQLAKKAGVAPRVLAEGAGQERAGEAVDLRAVVVEVVLPRHRRARRLQDPSQAVADRRPAHAADVQRTGGVGGHELEVERDTRQRLVLPVLGALLDDRVRQLPGGGRVEPDVEEAGSGHLDRGDTLGGGESAGQLLGERAGVRAGLLGQLHRHVGGPVAVLALPRSLEVHRRGDRGGVEGERAVVDGVHEGGPKGLGELSGGHRRRVPSRTKPRCSHPDHPLGVWRRSIPRC
jgi:hypothetical protein